MARGEGIKVKPAALAPLLRRCAVLGLLLAGPHAAMAQGVDVPFVPTPASVVDVMLKLAGVGPDDYVIDLGSGDGRIVIAAAKNHGARGFGVDLDSALVAGASREARRQGVGNRVQFKVENLFLADIDRATVLTMYLFPSLMLRVRPRLFAELRPGTRVVSHEFGMENWQPEAHVTVPVPDKPHGPPSSDVYLWIIPANASGTWRWRLDAGGTPVEYEIALSQTFQMLEGRPLVGGGAGRLEGGRMRGEEIRFTLTAEVGGRALRHEFSGRVSGDAISGIVKLAGAGELDWKATRVRRGKIEEQ